MNESLYEELAKKHPDLLHKAGVDHFEIADGWYNIVDTLCEVISYDVSQIRGMIGYANKIGNYGIIPKLELDLSEAIGKLPVIEQVKEKFGGMRFYVDSTSDENYHYIDFAEKMSSKTCEVCGSPGKARSGGWIKVLCDTHNSKNESVD